MRMKTLTLLYHSYSPFRSDFYCLIKESSLVTIKSEKVLVFLRLALLNYFASTEQKWSRSSVVAVH